MTPTASRRCSECGGSLAGKGPKAVTCDQSCRAKRSRRLRASKKAGPRARAMPEHQKLVSEIVRYEAPDIGRDLMKEELRPVVRESITEDTIRALRDMVALTPAAVEALSEDLSSEDATLRQRAYTLVMKYTVGHQALVRPDDADGSKQIIVNFALPRPGVESRPDPSVPGEAEELRHCEICDADKPLSDFIANSYRCSDCHSEVGRIADRYVT